MLDEVDFFWNQPAHHRTPGIRRALKALAARKRANVRRVAAGKSPLVAGKGGKLKKVSAKSLGLTKEKAKERLRKRG